MRHGLWMGAVLALGMATSASAQFTEGYIVPWYYSGPIATTLPAWQMNRPTAFPRLGGNLPIAGLNTPAIVSRPAGPGYTRRASSSATARRQAAETQRDTAIERAQANLASRLKTLMEDRPLVNATVVKVGATGASVQLEDGPKKTPARVPLEEVFFFRSGELATASGSPGVLKEGDQVLVARP